MEELGLFVRLGGYLVGEVSLKLNEWAMFQHTNEFNSVYFQTAFENKHIIKRCFGLQIYKAETRHSIERRYVRRSIEQPPPLQKNGGLLNYYRLRFRFPQPQLLSRTCSPFVFPLPPQYRHGWRADRSETMFHKNLFLWNSQGNLQYGCCKLPKYRCCVEPAASVPLHCLVRPCTSQCVSLLAANSLLVNTTDIRVRSEHPATPRLYPYETLSTVPRCSVSGYCWFFCPNVW